MDSNSRPSRAGKPRCESHTTAELIAPRNAGHAGDPAYHLVPDDQHHTSLSVALPASYIDLEFTSATSNLDNTLTAKDWLDLLEIDKTLANAGVEYNAESETENDSAVARLIETMSAKKIPESDLELFYRATKPDSLLPPPLEMPERPSTIYKAKDNLGFNMSEFFDFDAAAADDSSPPRLHSADQFMPDAGSSSHNPVDKFDPAVSFSQYLKISELELSPKMGNSKSRSEVTFPGIKNGISSAKAEKPKHGAESDEELLRRAFKAGTEDCSLPMFQDPAYEEEFAAFKEAGESISRQFQDLRKGSQSRNLAAAPPSTGLFTNTQACENFANVTNTYVRHLPKQNPELSELPNYAQHQYTDAEIACANKILTEDVKTRMKQSYGTRAKNLESTAVDFNQSLNEAFGSTEDWTGYDNMMSLSELDAEWDAFDGKSSHDQVLTDDHGTTGAPKGAATASKFFSANPVASLATVENDEISMIPTFSQVDRASATLGSYLNNKPNKIITQNAGESRFDDSSLVGFVAKLSNIKLGSAKEHDGRNVLQTAAKNSTGISHGDGKIMPGWRAFSKQELGKLKDPPIISDAPTSTLIFNKDNLSNHISEPHSSLEAIKHTPFGQSIGPSPTEDTNSAQVRSAARSQKMDGSQSGQLSTPDSRSGITTLADNIQSPRKGKEQNDSSDSKLPVMRDVYIDDHEERDLTYPARTRLFSDKLDVVSPNNKSDPLEPFEDLPQKPHNSSTMKSDKILPGVTNATPSSAASNLGNSSSVTFSFSNKRLCAITAQRLEELLVAGSDPTLQSLRMWPSFSTSASTTQSTFEFKVTSSGDVNVVHILHDLFPLMITKMRGDQLLFVPGDKTSSNSDSRAASLLSEIETPTAAAAKVKKPKKMDGEAIGQQLRNSTMDGGVSEVQVELQDTREAKRRRPNPKDAEMLAEQGNTVMGNKKQNKTKN